ncbi:MAG: VanW family protein [bacterium]|nr:VanW family protein [bacterium]
MTLVSVIFLSAGSMNVSAAQNERDRADSQTTICEGVYAGDISLSGMTPVEAEQAIGAYIGALAQTPITFNLSAEQAIQTTAGELGLRFGNPEILAEAVSFGRKGNILKRYKEIADLAANNQVYEIELAFDRAAIETIVQAQSEAVNVPAQNASMTIEDGAFVYTEGVDGIELDVASSVDLIYTGLTGQWEGEAQSFDLQLQSAKPAHDVEELKQISDVLATCTTSFATSDSARSANVRNACNKVNGTVLFPGEEFSTLAVIAPFTERNGYYSAGSYSGGKVVDSVGGGICQVSSTLYNAVLYSELEVTNRSNHAMAVGYVKIGLDATVSEDSGIDFTFVNNTEYPIYIEGYTTTNKRITMTIYGVETRPETHSVAYESVVLETTPPGAEAVYADASQPIGAVDIQPAHTGYVADVYRIVTENGVEVSREQISHNTYKMTCRSATVGTSTSDPVAYDMIQAAIATGSVDHAKAVAAQIASGNYGQSAETSAQPGGVEIGGVPGIPDGGMQSGAPDSGAIPGVPDTGVIPGVPDGGVIPGIPDGGVQPGASDAGTQPGTP